MKFILNCKIWWWCCCC